MNRTYVVWTLILAVMILGYIALASDTASIRSQEVMAAEGDPPDVAPDANPSDARHNLWMIVGTTVLVVLAVIGTVILANLQHRRHQAYRKAARQQRQQVKSSAAGHRGDDHGEHR